MIQTLTHETPVLVQGITGRMGRSHTRLMQAYGTRIVGGVSAQPDKAGVDGVHVFGDCRSAVAATGAAVSIVMLPPFQVRQAVDDALSAGIRLIVTIAEGVPLHDAMHIGRMARAANALWVGPSTPGIAVPGEMKLGFLPDVALRPGPFAIMSKSGTLSYEVGYRLVRADLGQSLWVGVGGDPVKGLRFADLVDPFFSHAQTEALILIGEVGGNEEEEFADSIARHGLKKPVYAIIAGKEAKEGISMGHAGALTYGDVGSFASKVRRLQNAGVYVFETIEGLVNACVRDFASAPTRT